MTIKAGDKIPSVTFKKITDDGLADISSDDYFKGRKVALFSVPGAFTPTCSTYQLPNFEKMYADFSLSGIDEIYCMSVNDAFVMNAWAKDQKLEYVKVIPDGSGEFTRGMGMLVDKDNLSFGKRSWRYAALINDGIVEMFWEEPGRMDNCPDDPYGETSPENILATITGGE